MGVANQGMESLQSSIGVPKSALELGTGAWAQRVWTYRWTHSRQETRWGVGGAVRDL